MTLRLLATRVETEQLAGDLLGTLLDAAPRPLPLPTAEPGQLGMRLRAADITVDAVEMLGGNEESIALGVLQQHVFVHRAAVIGDGAHLDESRNAVVAMHDQVSRCELEHECLARSVPAGCAA